MKLVLAILLGCLGALAADTATFSATLYPVLEKAGCRSCHNSDGVASATRLQFPEEGASAERLEAFGKSLVVLVDAKRPEQSLLLRKPTNRIAHAGGLRITPGTAEEAALRAWVDRLAAMQGEELTNALHYGKDRDGDSGPRPVAAIRRLTSSQYNNTVRDLLGARTAPANQFPPEDFVNGFKNQYDAQSLSPILTEAYGAAAEALARNAFRGGDSQHLIPCKPSAACRAEFVRSFGRKAFRRPLSPEEVKRYERLFAREADFLAGAKLVVEVMLQSPNFLFRRDETSNPQWKAYATASRLSYSVWDTMPDDALLAAAARGELDSKAGVQAALRRMLADPKAKQALDEFVSQWLRFDRALTSTKDRRRFPEFTADTASAMTRETRTFIADLVWQDRNFMELFTADYGYMNGDLARLYGVRAPQTDFERVKFPPESERAGLLGQALFLTLTSKPDDTSPTARGLFVREQLLCQHVPDPPPGVNTNLPAVSESKPLSNRERLGEHTTNKSCAGCHSLIDPIGFGLEKFDAIGGRREKQPLTFAREGKKGAGRPKVVEVELNTAGSVAGIPNSNFVSPRELGAILASSKVCQECVVKQYFRYTSGRMETIADRALLRKVFEDFKASDFHFRDLIISMISSIQFPELGATANVANHH